jgi:hypothetical protein
MAALTAGELGIDQGYEWARLSRAKRIALVGEQLEEPVTTVVTTGVVPEPVRRLVHEAGLTKYVSPDQEDVFWQGWVAGACAWVAEEAQRAQQGMGHN